MMKRIILTGIMIITILAVVVFVVYINADMRRYHRPVLKTEILTNFQKYFKDFEAIQSYYDNANITEKHITYNNSKTLKTAPKEIKKDIERIINKLDYVEIGVTPEYIYFFEDDNMIERTIYYTKSVNKINGREIDTFEYIRENWYYYEEEHPHE